MSNLDQLFILTVIARYGLATDGQRVDNLVTTWLQKYDRDWILKAIVECVHQGRYKLISVDRILQIWQRLGAPRLSFAAEYERNLLDDLPVPQPQDLPDNATTAEPSADDRPAARALPPIDCTALDPDESAPLSHLGRLGVAIHRVEVDVAATTESVDLAVAVGEASPSANRAAEIAAIVRPEFLPAIDPRCTQPANFQLFQTLKTIVDTCSTSDCQQPAPTLMLPLKYSQPPQQFRTIGSSEL